MSRVGSIVPSLCGRKQIGLVVIGLIVLTSRVSRADDAARQKLAREVAALGWIVFAGHPAEIDARKIISQKSARGQLDLYLMRPDGSHLHNITNTPEFHEFGGRFSPDGQHLLYRQLPNGAPINHDLWGATGRLMVANSDGSDPHQLGDMDQYPWASFGPDIRRIACLDKRGGVIRIYAYPSLQPVRKLASKGIFQQLFWAPDGQHLVGTANVQGRPWNVVAIDCESGQRTVLTRALNCTPDWFRQDPTRVIYSNRNPALFPGQYNDYGLTMLMAATADGKQRRLLYGNANRHCYFGCLSPADKYIVFCDDAHDGLIVGAMHLIRLADTPIIPPALKKLRLLYPDASTGPVLNLELAPGTPLRGFEPHWTDRDIGGRP